MQIVIDTSVVIDFLRRRDAEKSVFARFSGKIKGLISLVTVAELYAGKSVQDDPEKKKRVETMLTGVEINIPTLDTARQTGTLRAKYQLSLADAFIAALAIESGLPLATFNKKDFAKVKELELFELD